MIARTRIISIDFGMARIGMACSDESHTIALPLVTVKCERKMEDTVQKLLAALAEEERLKQFAVAEIVVGLPLMMSGKKGLLADEALIFAELLRQKSAYTVVTWDERLTTVQAERTLRESTLTRKKRAKVVDSVAAVIILQNYLDHRKIQQDL